MLSNTATPKYYGAFRDAVLRGEIPVCEEISLEMNLIDELIADPDVYYDDKAADGFIAFCEEELTQTDGSDIKLLDSFKLWAEQIFCWYEFVPRNVFIPGKNGEEGHYVVKLKKKRLINKMFLIIGRGAAKTMFVSFLHAYFLTVDTSTTIQITTAPTMRQAEEVLSPIKTAITRAKGPFFKFLTEGSINNTTGPKSERVKLSPTKKGIENFITGSILQIVPMSIDKIQGSRAVIVTVDEWLSGDTKEDVIGAAEQGAQKNEDYLIVATSSEGTVRNGPGDSIKMELRKILKKEYQAKHVAIWWYKMDSIEEVSNPNLWIKANPNIAALPTGYEAYQRDYEKMNNVPEARNDILAKRFGLPMEGFTYFFTYNETILHRKQNCDGMACAMGIDLSQGDDFCAFTFLYPINGGSKFGVKSRCYVSSFNLHKLPSALRHKYDEFIQEDSLCVLDGAYLDLTQVYEDLDNFIIEHNYDVRCIGFDPYNAKEFVDRWQLENGPYGIEKVIQGAKTESVPLGEIKSLAEERLLLFDQEIVKFTMGNAMVSVDTNGNRKLYKRKREEKIDCVSALMDAFVSYKLHREAFE